MQDEGPSNRGHEKARVRSADAAVLKAVEHEAALERKAEKRSSRHPETKPSVRQAETAEVRQSGSSEPKQKPKRTKRVSTKELYGIKKRHKGLVPLLVIPFLLPQPFRLSRILHHSRYCSHARKVIWIISLKDLDSCGMCRRIAKY